MHLGHSCWRVLAAHRLTAHLAHPLGGHQRDHVAAADDAHQPPAGEHRDAADPPVHQQVPHVVGSGVLGDADHRRGHHVAGGGPPSSRSYSLTSPTTPARLIDDRDCADPVLSQGVSHLLR